MCTRETIYLLYRKKTPNSCCYNLGVGSYTCGPCVCCSSQRICTECIHICLQLGLNPGFITSSRVILDKLLDSPGSQSPPVFIPWIFPWCSVGLSMVYTPASESPGVFVSIQISEPHSKPNESESLAMGRNCETCQLPK